MPQALDSRPYLCSLITTKDCMNYKHLNSEQRYTISVLLQRDEPMSRAEIARTIGVHRSTVSRKLKRNSDGRGHHKYEHDLAQRKADKRMKDRPHAYKFTDEMKRDASRYIIYMQYSPAGDRQMPAARSGDGLTRDAVQMDLG